MSRAVGHPSHGTDGVRFFLEGQETSRVGIVVNSGLNFGRRWDDLATRSYELSVPLADLGWLAAEFGECAEEMREDDISDDDPSPFVGLEYETDLFAAAQKPTAFAEVVGLFFGRRILERYFETDTTTFTLVINELEEVEVAGSSLRLKGWGFVPR